VQALPADQGQVFQTWNPLRSLNPTDIISEAWFDRPVLSPNTVAHLDQLASIQGVDNVWYCGSYAHPGIPLLESAVSSGLEVASRLAGVALPFDIPNRHGTLTATSQWRWLGPAALLVLFLSIFTFCWH
jgi:predicted NAD/FAD-binding protein